MFDAVQLLLLAATALICIALARVEPEGTIPPGEERGDGTVREHEPACGASDQSEECLRWSDWTYDSKIVIYGDHDAVEIE